MLVRVGWCVTKAVNAVENGCHIAKKEFDSGFLFWMWKCGRNRLSHCQKEFDNSSLVRVGWCVTKAVELRRKCHGNCVEMLWKMVVTLQKRSLLAASCYAVEMR
jgi:hypothetical protein